MKYMLVCDCGRVDVANVRERLRELRFLAGFEVADLAEKADLHKATIYRTEDLSVAYTPELETIDKWVRACEWTVTEFFRRVELSLPVTAGVDKDSDRPPSTQGEIHGRSRALRPLDDAQRKLLEELGWALIAAVRPTEPDQTEPGSVHRTGTD